MNVPRAALLSIEHVMSALSDECTQGIAQQMTADSRVLLFSSIEHVVGALSGNFTQSTLPKRRPLTQEYHSSAVSTW
jgi:hypothetical protein